MNPIEALKAMFLDRRSLPRSGIQNLFTEIERLKSQLDEFVYVEANPDYVSEGERLQNNIRMSAGLKCPSVNCGDQGFVPVQISDDEWEQQQCEFCYCIDDSVFSRNQKALKEQT